jgi:hypothetical protein
MYDLKTLPAQAFSLFEFEKVERIIMKLITKTPTAYSTPVDLIK